MAADISQVNFRMPTSLKERLERAAKSNERSLTSEIIFRLQETLEMDASAADIAERVHRTPQGATVELPVSEMTAADYPPSVVTMTLKAIRDELAEIKEALSKAEKTEE
jgi:hypothetical protein